jgi:hypothetical protein
MESCDFHLIKVEEGDSAIESVLASLNASRPEPSETIPKVRHAKGRNEPRFDVRSARFVLVGADLSRIRGFGPYTVLRLTAKCGNDMRRCFSFRSGLVWLTGFMLLSRA